jgi:outer membrane protein TolC
MKALKGYIMHLKNYVSLILITTLTLVASDNSELLSALKQQKVDIDKQKVELENDNLKYDWVEQVTMTYTNKSYNGKISGDSSTQDFSISLTQPIFKSGGIYYAIQYAGANREFARLSTTLSEQNQIKSLIASWLLIKKYDLQIQRQQYLIENAKIDIIRKQEQYDAGFLDSSFLDQAILTKTNLEKSLIDLESARYTQLMSFESLSDANYKEITPPTFTMIDKNDYMQNSLLIAQQNFEVKRAEYLKKLTVSNYLPTVSFLANYYDYLDNGSYYNDSYSYFGLQISMPLFDINRGRSIELKQLDYLKSKLESEDIKKEEGNLYSEYVKKIELLNKKIAIVQNDAKLYDSLLLSTKELYGAGEKTIYDVDNLNNSKQTMLLDEKIYEIDVQSVLLDLYAKMNGKI